MRIKLQQFTSLIRLVVLIIILTYFIGIFWFLFAKISTSDELVGWEGDDEDSPHVVGGYFLNSSNWSIINESGGKQTLIAMYFALTSMSTTGFGDFYPVTDSERLIYAFMMLCGVCIFAYFEGEFSRMYKIIS